MPPPGTASSDHQPADSHAESLHSYGPQSGHCLSSQRVRMRATAHPRALGYSHFPDFRSYCLVIGPTIGGDSQSNPPEVRRNRPNGMRQTAAKSPGRLAPRAAPHQTTGDRVKRARGKPRSPQLQYSQWLSQGHARLSPGRTPSFLPSRRCALQDLELRRV